MSNIQQHYLNQTIKENTMSQVKLVKQRVCLAIFTLGLSLAAFVEIGCSPEQNYMVHSLGQQISHVVVIKG